MFGFKELLKAGKEIVKETGKELLNELKAHAEPDAVDHGHIQNIADVTPTEEELSSLALACHRLWMLDSNRLEPITHYKIDLQKEKKPYQTGDVAGKPLFAWVDPAVFQRDTFRTFIALLDNYIAVTGQTEQADATEIREMHDFLDACLRSNVMRFVTEYLMRRGIVKSAADFKQEMWNLWFRLYKREVANDSSGFEHVFVGEIRNNEVLGMHNWIQIYNEEKKGKLDYQGYIMPRRRVTRGDDLDGEQLLTFQFLWHGKPKHIGSSFIGTSPEFELALYTLCFLCGDEDNEMHIGPYAVIVKCHKIARDKIGTSYPEFWIEEDGASGAQSAHGAHKPKPEKRPGDWTCSGCGANVWGSKDKCFKCGKPKD